ncbi:MAG: hypothetical protein AAGA30_21045, partial [Planctomycetota bacterium]
VDEALADLHEISRNLVIDTLLLEGDEELRFTRHATNVSGASAAAVVTTNDMLFFDLAFDGANGLLDSELWLRQSVYHEIGHHYDGLVSITAGPSYNFSLTENPTIEDFYTISWNFPNSPPTILPGSTFARDYGSTLLFEDFATSFAANMMDRAGLAYQGVGYQGQAVGAVNIPAKMVYMDNFFATV